MVTRYNHPAKFPRVKSAQDKIVTTPMYDPKKPSRLHPRIEAAAEAVQARNSADQADKMAAHAAGAPQQPSVNTSSAPKQEEVNTKMAEAQPEEMTLEEMRKRGIAMTPEQWLIRIIFLESIAGVPGFVAASVRHLHSLRLMRRDKGWIRTLLEDAEVSQRVYVFAIGQCLMFVALLSCLLARRMNACVSDSCSASS
jgi:Alternative oxidase